MAKTLKDDAAHAAHDHTDGGSADTPSIDRIEQPPAHELVVDQIRRAIQLGRFLPGDKLPAERDLAGLLGVSRATAYRHWTFARAWLLNELGATD